MIDQLKREGLKIAIIGSGFAGISASAYLARQGYQVDVYEKNAAVGGRTRQLVTPNGYVFDMGPSRYWMPEVFERFFSDFGYKVEDFYKPGLSLWELANADLIKGIFKLQVFTSFSAHVKRYFNHPKLIALLEFPMLFLGAMPEDTPALHSLMNYAALKLGTWYPKGGLGKVIEAMKAVAEKQGVQFHTNAIVTAWSSSIIISGNVAAKQLIKYLNK